MFGCLTLDSLSKNQKSINSTALTDFFIYSQQPWQRSPEQVASQAGQCPDNEYLQAAFNVMQIGEFGF